MKTTLLASALLAMGFASGCMSTGANAPMAEAGMASDMSMSTSAMASTSNPMVGGAAMYASKDIVDNAVNSRNHTTLVAAVKAAGLVDSLKGPGPFTVFAPTNAAFDMLPAGTVDTLLKPSMKA
jgi:uncharacterized surface protein with fasciclin (FAS1) repeats